MGVFRVCGAWWAWVTFGLRGGQTLPSMDAELAPRMAAFAYCLHPRGSWSYCTGGYRYCLRCMRVRVRC